MFPILRVHRAEGDPAPPATDPKPGDPAPDPKPDDQKLFTQADLNRIVAKEVADRDRKASEREAAIQRTAEEARLKEQGEYKVIAERREAELEELRGQVEKEKRTAIALKVGAEKRLTTWETSKLTGTTYEEMIADADLAIKERTPPTPGNSDPGRPGGGSGKPTVEEAAARLKKSGDYQRV